MNTENKRRDIRYTMFREKVGEFKAYVIIALTKRRHSCTNETNLKRMNDATDV